MSTHVRLSSRQSGVTYQSRNELEFLVSERGGICLSSCVASWIVPDLVQDQRDGTVWVLQLSESSDKVICSFSNRDLNHETIDPRACGGRSKAALGEGLIRERKVGVLSIFILVLVDWVKLNTEAITGRVGRVL